MTQGSKIKHAQNDERFFREVWRLTLCGHSVDQIATHLRSSQPTIRRTQTRIRSASPEDPGPDTDVFAPLFEAARELRIPNLLSWDRYVAVIRQFFYGAQEVSFAAKHKCMTKCPVRQSPKKFANRYIRYHHVEGERYILSLLEFNDPQSLQSERKAHLRCRACPLKNYKTSVFADYESDSYLFLCLMFYLSRYRFRGLDERDIILVYAEVAIFGMIQELVLKRMQDTVLEGGSDDDAIKAAETFFIELSDKVFDRILLGL